MAIAIIPARYAATRLPGKPLVVLDGKSMIQRVWERVRQASKISRVIVATDDQRIVQAVTAFGGEAVMTRSEHRSGTERVAEIAAAPARKDEDIFVNVQGDEPLIEPAAIDTAGRDKGLVEETENDKDQEHRFIEAGDQVREAEALQPGRGAEMAGRNTKAAHEQKSHRQEQQSADGHGRQRIGRPALQQREAQGMGAREKAEDDPALR